MAPPKVQAEGVAPEARFHTAKDQSRKEAGARRPSMPKPERRKAPFQQAEESSSAFFRLRFRFCSTPARAPRWRGEGCCRRFLEQSRKWLGGSEVGQQRNF